MKRKHSKYPIGATWEAEDNTGRIGKIYLSSRNEYFEVWNTEVHYADGSSHFGDNDWYMSFAQARKFIPIYLGKDGKPIRFKRIK